MNWRSADDFAAELGDHKIVTTLCPGGQERTRRLMELVRHRQIDLTPLLTHSFALDQIVDAHKLFKEQRDDVLGATREPEAVYAGAKPTLPHCVPMRRILSGRLDALGDTTRDCTETRKKPKC